MDFKCSIYRIIWLLKIGYRLGLFFKIKKYFLFLISAHYTLFCHAFNDYPEINDKFTNVHRQCFYDSSKFVTNKLIFNENTLNIDFNNQILKDSFDLNEDNDKFEYKNIEKSLKIDSKKIQVSIQAELYYKHHNDHNKFYLLLPAYEGSKMANYSIKNLTLFHDNKTIVHNQNLNLLKSINRVNHLFPENYIDQENQCDVVSIFSSNYSKNSVNTHNCKKLFLQDFFLPFFHHSILQDKFYDQSILKSNPEDDKYYNDYNKFNEFNRYNQIYHRNNSTGKMNSENSSYSEFKYKNQNTKNSTFENTSDFYDNFCNSLKLDVQETPFNNFCSSILLEVKTNFFFQKGDTLKFNFEYILGDSLIPSPDHIGISDPQNVELLMYTTYLSPYKSLNQKITINLDKQFSLVQDSNDDSLKAWKIGFSKGKDQVISINNNNVGSFDMGEIARFHFVMSKNLALFRCVSREILISPLNLISFKEIFILKNNAAKLKGMFSRADHAELYGVELGSKQEFRSTEGHVLDYLTSTMDNYTLNWSYYDEIGYISSVKTHRRKFRNGRYNPHYFIKVYPRFSLYGGWKTDFTISYDVSSEIMMKQKKLNFYLSRYMVSIPLKSSIDDIYTQHNFHKMVLPYGASNIKIYCPENFDRIHFGVTYNWLDILTGRKTLFLYKYGGYRNNELRTADNVLLIFYDAKSPFFYNFYKSTILSMIIFSIFLLVSGISRMDTRIYSKAEEESLLRKKLEVKAIDDVEMMSSDLNQLHDSIKSFKNKSMSESDHKDSLKKIVFYLEESGKILSNLERVSSSTMMNKNIIEIIDTSKEIRKDVEGFLGNSKLRVNDDVMDSNEFCISIKKKLDLIEEKLLTIRNNAHRLDESKKRD